MTLAKYLDVRFGAMTIILFAITVSSIVLGELANWATVVKGEDNETKLSKWYVSVPFITLIPGMLQEDFLLFRQGYILLYSIHMVKSMAIFLPD